MSTTKTVSVRLPDPLIQEATRLRPDAKMTEIIVQAVTAWVVETRRQEEDNLVKNALASLSPQQRQAEQEMAALAGRSTLRILGDAND